MPSLYLRLPLMLLVLEAPERHVNSVETAMQIQIARVCI